MKGKFLLYAFIVVWLLASILGGVFAVSAAPPEKVGVNWTSGEPAEIAVNWTSGPDNSNNVNWNS